jgi:hypothetical protein
LGKSWVFHCINPDHYEVRIEVCCDIRLSKNFVSHLLGSTVISEKMEKEGALLLRGASRCNIQLGLPANCLQRRQNGKTGNRQETDRKKGGQNGKAKAIH